MSRVYAGRAEGSWALTIGRQIAHLLATATSCAMDANHFGVSSQLRSPSRSSMVISITLHEHTTSLFNIPTKQLPLTACDGYCFALGVFSIPHHSMAGIRVWHTQRPAPCSTCQLTSEGCLGSAVLELKVLGVRLSGSRVSPRAFCSTCQLTSEGCLGSTGATYTGRSTVSGCSPLQSVPYFGAPKIGALGAGMAAGGGGSTSSGSSRTSGSGGWGGLQRQARCKVADLLLPYWLLPARSSTQTAAEPMQGPRT
jgi:hypothetical protein